MHYALRPRLKVAPSRGFTLIELMIVVAIVAILAAVALPAYRDYVIRGNIPQATANLAAKQTKIEQYFQDNLTYSLAPDCTGTDSGTSQYFDFSCTGVSSSAYTLQAAGKGSMQGFTYTINQSNTRTSDIASPAPSGWVASSGNCWIVKRGGTC